MYVYASERLIPPSNEPSMARISVPAVNVLVISKKTESESTRR